MSGCYYTDDLGKSNDTGNHYEQVLSEMSRLIKESQLWLCAFIYMGKMEASKNEFAWGEHSGYWADGMHIIMSFCMLSCALQIISSKFHSKYPFTIKKKISKQFL